jgi:hypothetical protein
VPATGFENLDMGFSPDVLATALQDLMPGYSDLFTKHHPLYDAIVNKRKNIDTTSLKGPYRTFNVVTGGPGQARGIVTGTETIAGGRRQNAYTGTVKGARIIYAWDVPGKDLAEANGEHDFGKILKKYPEEGLNELNLWFGQQLAVGTGSANGVDGLVTLAGPADWSPDGTALDGVFEFDAPESQNDTVFNIPKPAATNGVAGWYNQYGDISAFATDGRRTMRDVYYDAQSESAMTAGSPDLLFGDTGSYDNYVDDLDDQVRIVAPSTSGGDRAPGNVRKGIAFEDAVFYRDISIDRSASTLAATPAADGLIYVIHSDTWHAFVLPEDEISKGQKKGHFTLRGPIRHPTLDAWRFEYVWYGNFYCDQLRRNGAITGGAV